MDFENFGLLLTYELQVEKLPTQRFNNERILAERPSAYFYVLLSLYVNILAKGSLQNTAKKPDSYPYTDRIFFSCIKIIYVFYHF